jgi:hypothetical protein
MLAGAAWKSKSASTVYFRPFEADYFLTRLATASLEHSCRFLFPPAIQKPHIRFRVPEGQQTAAGRKNVAFKVGPEAQACKALLVAVPRSNQMEPLNPVEQLNVAIRVEEMRALVNHEQVIFEDLVHQAQAEFDRRFPQQQNPDRSNNRTEYRPRQVLYAGRGWVRWICRIRRP